MTQRTIIRDRLNYVRGWLNDVLPRLTPEMLPWAPAPGMRTIAGQLVEIVAVEATLVPALRDGTLPADEELAAIANEEMPLDALLQALIDVRSRTLAYLDHLSENDLAAELVVPQWYGAYWKTPLPCGEHFRNVAEHEFYHAGQLITYLWARGDDPYAW